MTAPKWLHVAIDELTRRIVEIPGSEANPRIAAYLHTVGQPSDDEIAWCAAFVNFCLIEASEVPPGLANARSLLEWGEPCDAKPGAVVVFWRESPESWKGHVGFLLGTSKASAYVLGGNQSNSVCVAAYPLASVLGYRWAKAWGVT